MGLLVLLAIAINNITSGSTTKLMIDIRGSTSESESEQAMRLRILDLILG